MRLFSCQKYMPSIYFFALQYAIVYAVAQLKYSDTEKLEVLPQKSQEHNKDGDSRNIRAQGTYRYTTSKRAVG